MNEKKADNIILEKNNKENKQIINQIDNAISKQKGNLHKIDNTQETLVEINKSINRCLDLLSKNMNSKESRRKIDNMRTNSMIILKKASGSLEDTRQNTKQVINKLYTNRNQFEKKSKESKKEE